MPNESRPDAKSPFRPMVIILGLIVVVPLLLCLGVLTWFFGRQSIASSELQDRVEQIEREGMPIGDPTLKQFHDQLTSGENTALWVETRKLTESDAFREAAVPLSNRPVA